MSKIDFQWDMNEQDWRQMINDLSAGDAVKPRDYYGTVRFGNCKSLFTITGTSPDRHLYSKTYVLGHNTGYGYTVSGRPYYLSELDFSIPECPTFEKFRTICERGIALHVGQYGLYDDAFTKTLSEADWQ